MRASALIVVLVGLGACGNDDGVTAELRAGGDGARYVRCLAAEPAAERSWHVGELRLTAQGRALQIEGLPDVPRVAAFAGPAPSSARVVDALGEVRADLIVVLGSIGDDERVARRTVADLAAARAPALLIAGGRDERATIARALAALRGTARDRVIDATALRRIELGDDVLVPLAGAPRGRYARSGNACGFSAGDADAVAREATAGARENERRWLVSWAAPTPSRGLGGVETGDRLVARVAERIAARMTLAAWPEVGAGLGLTDDILVAPPIAGLVLQRPDGTRVMPGHVAVTLGPHGPTFQDGSLPQGQ